LAGRKLIVEVNSAARAEKAIAQMGEWLGDCVSTPMTEIRTLAQFMADDAARAPQEEPLDIPPDEMERIVHDMLTREYTKTLDEAVPALGNKTPRALARTKAGRAKVADWLKYMRMAQQNPGSASQWLPMILRGCGKSWASSASAGDALARRSGIVRP
jgi:hypothetical protein